MTVLHSVRPLVLSSPADVYQAFRGFSLAGLNQYGIDGTLDGTLLKWFPISLSERDLLGSVALAVDRGVI